MSVANRSIAEIERNLRLIKEEADAIRTTPWGDAPNVSCDDVADEISRLVEELTA